MFRFTNTKLNVNDLDRLLYIYSVCKYNIYNTETQLIILFISNIKAPLLTLFLLKLHIRLYLRM